ncbi:MAG: hypothetical protein KBD64_02135, partial [Gammaproteobacteria bacterium]|nr:hypothetical protein [Gammaproteobacteria bacterium]
MSSASRTRKAASKKKTGLPGSNISQHFQVARKQAKDLVSKAQKKVAASRVTQQSHAKKHKLAQDTLKKHEAKHKSSPTKSTAKNIKSAKSRVKQAFDAHNKSQNAHKQATDTHANHQNHLAKLNHLHNALTEADRKWSKSNQTGQANRSKKKTAKKSSR